MKNPLVIGGIYKLVNGITVGNNEVWNLTYADIKEDKVKLKPANNFGLPILWESSISKFDDHFEQVL